MEGIVEGEGGKGGTLPGGERKFTPMDVDVVPAPEEGDGGEAGENKELKRNPDGSICEDCN